MNNVSRIVDTGMCTGCSACDICENITFSQGNLGFLVPHVSKSCVGCGNCLDMCIFDPLREED